MKRNLILLFAVLLIIVYALSCSGPVPPVQTDIKVYTDLDATFDEVWEGVIALFADNMYTIQTIEKSSGIIVTEKIKYKTGLITDKYTGKYITILGPCNCGKSANYGFLDLFVKFNIFVREIDKNKTRIQVNAKFWKRAVDGMVNIAWECVSTGQLENWIISEIETKYLKKK